MSNLWRDQAGALRVPSVDWPAPVQLSGAAFPGIAASRTPGGDVFAQRKFGVAALTTSARTVWAVGGLYTGFIATAATVSVVSSAAADTAAGTGLRSVRIEGLDANYAPQGETLTLAGLTPVVSTLTFARVNRAYGLAVGSGEVNAGAVTASSTGAGTPILCRIPVGLGQTQLCAWTIPAGYTGYLLKISAYTESTKPARLELWSREWDSASSARLSWRSVLTVAGFSETVQDEVTVTQRFPERTDLDLRMSLATGTGDGSAEFHVVCVKN